MDGLADLPIGRRVAALRKLCGMTQAGLAARLHRSESWVTKIERGERRIDSMIVLQELSTALDVPMYKLTGRSHVMPSQIAQPENADLLALRRVLDRPAVAGLGAGVVRPLVDLEREAVALRTLYNRARHNFSAVLPRLPNLISEAQSAASTTSIVGAPRVNAVQAGLYRLASLALRRRGDMPRARVAIDRAMWAAEASGDLVLVGAVGAFYTLQLMVQGDPEAGVTAAMALADIVARDAQANTLAGVVVSGALYHYAASAAATAGDEKEARRLLKVAMGSAERLGRDCEAHGLLFGPANMTMQQIATLVILDRPQEALRLAGPISPAPLGSVNRYGFYSAFLARAQSMCGREDDALATIAAGVRMAPELVRDHVDSREIVQDVVRRALHRRRQVGEDLRRLARDLNLPD